MTTQEEISIEQGTKLINNFLKLKGSYRRSDYHLDWEALMPVVEKIRDTPMIKGKVLAQASYWESICEALLVVSLSKIYSAVVQFIQWYNSSK